MFPLRIPVKVTRGRYQHTATIPISTVRALEQLLEEPSVTGVILNVRLIPIRWEEDRTYKYNYDVPIHRKQTAFSINIPAECNIDPGKIALLIINRVGRFRM